MLPLPCHRSRRGHPDVFLISERRPARVVHGALSSSTLRTETIIQMLTSATAWLTGGGIDAFMAWVIYRDLPTWSHILDDKGAAHIARRVLAGTSDLVDMADTIYMPTWMVGPIVKSMAAATDAADSPHCLAPGYKFAMQHAEHKTAIVHLGSHWVVFDLCESEATLSAYDWMTKAMVLHEHAERFLHFLAVLLEDSKYLAYKVIIHDATSLPSLPHETDSCSCGVFASVFLYHRFKGAKVHFAQGQMLSWRLFMLHNILALR